MSSSLMTVVVGYSLMQAFMVFRKSSWVCKLFACLPLLVMVSGITLAVIYGIRGQYPYHWQIAMVGLSALAALYLVIVWVADVFDR
jgi:hypothetical protein